MTYYLSMKALAVLIVLLGFGWIGAWLAGHTLVAFTRLPHQVKRMAIGPAKRLARWRFIPIVNILMAALMNYAVVRACHARQEVLRARTAEIRNFIAYQRWMRHDRYAFQKSMRDHIRKKYGRP